MMEKQNIEPTGPLNCLINSFSITKSEQEIYSGEELCLAFHICLLHQIVLPTVKPCVETEMCCLPPQAVQKGH